MVGNAAIHTEHTATELLSATTTTKTAEPASCCLNKRAAAGTDCCLTVKPLSHITSRPSPAQHTCDPTDTKPPADPIVAQQLLLLLLQPEA